MLWLLLLPMLAFTNKCAAFLDPKLQFDEIISPDFNLNELLEDESKDDEFGVWQKCDNDLSKPSGINQYIDLPFMEKYLTPFGSAKMNMKFYLFTRDFPDCGRELRTSDTREELLRAGFDPGRQTRICIHGWMSQMRGTFYRDVKNAYLQHGDYNVILVDWSASAININYFVVVKQIEEGGALVAQFLQHLHYTVGAAYDDMYLIGHSLGAQMAGAAGKCIAPASLNTIYALDPAGPSFRHRSADFRIDPTDAKYVETIQTSAIYGMVAPTGHATFYVNGGKYQNDCYDQFCSHLSAYKFFAESIKTKVGFWGTRCNPTEPEWECTEDAASSELYRMGGESSVEKNGMFYVKTESSTPYAMGPKVNDNFLVKTLQSVLSSFG